MTEAAPVISSAEPVELTIDVLAVRAGLPVRTIREYQTTGLLPPPSRRGRIGVYGAHHLARLALIRRLQARGYSLAAIRDLLDSWRHGDDLNDVLGLGADELVHVEEPGVAVEASALARVLPRLVPDHLDALLETGVIERCGSGYCIPSPSLLHLTREALAIGYSETVVLDLLHDISCSASRVADAAVAALDAPPPAASTDDIVAFATRARGLLAHGLGRLTIHQIGRRLDIVDESEVDDRLRGRAEGSSR